MIWNHTKWFFHQTDRVSFTRIILILAFYTYGVFQTDIFSLVFVFILYFLTNKLQKYVIFINSSVVILNMLTNFHQYMLFYQNTLIKIEFNFFLTHVQWFKRFNFWLAAPTITWANSLNLSLHTNEKLYKMIHFIYIYVKVNRLYINERHLF